MAATIRNSAVHEEPAGMPVRADGSAYRFEMIHPDGSWRCYADSYAELVTALIAGYDELDDAGRARARLRFCVDIQVRLQAALATPELLGECSPEDCAIVLGGRDVPPSLQEWSAPVPLVLVTAFYAPAGPWARPEPRDRGEVVWLDPASDTGLLASLHRAGVLVLAVSNVEPEEHD